MAWKKGQSGNPLGRPTEKVFADAIRMVLAEDCPKTGKRKLRRLAEKLNEQAIEGEGWAMRQIADRLDGKPARESTLTLEDKRSARELSDEELIAIIEAGTKTN